MDMDGTLLDSNSKIPLETKKALIHLQQKGIKVVLASGRSVSRLEDIIQELKLRQYGGFCVEINGMAFYDAGTNRRVVLQRMDTKDAKELFQACMDLDGEVMAFYDDGLFDYHSSRLHDVKEKLRKEWKVDEDYPWTGGPWDWLMDLRIGYPHITYIDEVDQIDHVVNKVQIMEDPERMEEIYSILQQEFGDRFELYRTCPRLIEIMPKGVCKGVGLEKLMNQQGWTKEEIVVFGDGENDLSMFPYSNYSVAMGQSEDFVKKKADIVTLTNDQQGVLHILKQLFPNEL